MKNSIFITGKLAASVLLLASFTVFAQPGNYTAIPVVVKADSLKQKEDDFIRGEFDSMLIPAYSPDTMELSPGRLITRIKTSSGRYGFFSGVLDTSHFNTAGHVFVFRIPRWARFSDILHYRFYRSPESAAGSDEPIIYFDAERIYIRTFSRLHYFRNGIWFSIDGDLQKPLGSLSVVSVPKGASVFLNGTPAGCVTPCTIHNLIGGRYAVETRLPEYNFSAKSVTVYPDSVTSVSYELIADVDTVFITGDADYGLLLLPEPPSDKPYVVDDSIVLYTSRIRVPSGRHRISWKWDERYVALDTTVDIPSGKVTWFDYEFKRKYGIVRIVPLPPDAQVCLEKAGCGIGERVEELPSGIYRLSAFKHGFCPLHKEIRVYPDTIITYNVDMYQVADFDGDGYLDSCDGCPAVYGLYGGCPALQVKPVIRSLLGEVGEYIRSDRISVGFSLFGIVSKNSTNREFRNFLTAFSGGKIGGINNYKGITALNGVRLSGRGLFASLELGQWSSGLHYTRDDTLFIDSVNCFFRDSLNGIEPAVYFPSTSVSFGFHYTRSWLDIAYSVGYQWEDIAVRHICNRTSGGLANVTFDNDWWFHQLRLDIDFDNGDIYIPSLYFMMKYPFGPIHQTRWTVFNAGFQLKIATKGRRG